MNSCFEELPIKIYPLKEKNLKLYFHDWPENQQWRLLGIENLNPELLDFFKKKNIEIRENFIFWSWNTKQDKNPHTDGDWFSDDVVVKKRRCGINWCFTPGTWVEFYSTEGLNPEFRYRKENDFSTAWPGADKVIATWKTKGPVIFNPQIPHDIKSLDFINNRKSITLRFYETYESLREKLYA
jgi:hypothetical protein